MVVLPVDLEDTNDNGDIRLDSEEALEAIDSCVLVHGDSLVLEDRTTRVLYPAELRNDGDMWVAREVVRGVLSTVRVEKLRGVLNVLQERLSRHERDSVCPDAIDHVALQMMLIVRGLD